MPLSDYIISLGSITDGCTGRAAVRPGFAPPEARSPRARPECAPAPTPGPGRPGARGHRKLPRRWPRRHAVVAVAQPGHRVHDTDVGADTGDGHLLRPQLA